ncbi:hypothetical protein Pcinc_033439 [Petrolisthes cinctipes]|uniref:C2H2-type domain-containing protein n=1 Tax=Petrolisthes cinctipes TaxID=88211 RepID=A0AAE1ES52_PETCI|nr:hypothetical protein Pcinc_033439 [Petrolisthes cinctipes]
MFRKFVWEKLTRKVPLNQVERGYVLDGLYEECVRYSMYLDTHKYNIVLTRLLETFPYLQDGLSSDDALGLWRLRLRNKFKNNRRRRDQAQPEVQAKKSRIALVEARPKTTVLDNIWNIPNYLPPRPPTEDDTSIERYITQLKEQNSKIQLKRDASIVADAMSMTLSDRRSLIVKRNASLKDIKAEYPLLFCENEMIAEFSRLLGYDTQQKFCGGLQKYTPVILRLPPLKEERTCIQEMRIKAVSSTKIESERKYAQQCVALLLLHNNLKEKLVSFIRKEGEACHTEFRGSEGLTAHMRVVHTTVPHTHTDTDTDNISSPPVTSIITPHPTRRPVHYHYSKVLSNVTTTTADNNNDDIINNTTQQNIYVEDDNYSLGEGYEENVVYELYCPTLQDDDEEDDEDDEEDDDDEEEGVVDDDDNDDDKSEGGKVIHVYPCSECHIMFTAPLALRTHTCKPQQHTVKEEPISP